VRIRQVRPEFFTDPITARLPAAVQLTYIGLWCVADDAGWFRWDAATVGAVLYPFEPTKRRERHLTETMDVLVEAGRIVLFPCLCAHIPTLIVHQRIGGNKATPALDYHVRGHTWARKPDLRSTVMERDDYACRYCGRTTADKVRLVLEHVLNGGPTTEENLVTACQSCNTRKGTKTWEEAGMTLHPVPLNGKSILSQTRTPVTVSNGTVVARDGGLKEKLGPFEEVVKAK
jgi:hypothetical protein